MLVPSTFTGWYRNRITMMAITTLIARSRTHVSVAPIADRSGKARRWLAGRHQEELTASGVTSSIRNYLSPITNSSSVLRKPASPPSYTSKYNWGGWRDLNPRHPEPQSGATTN